jgi:hypothetical protein
VRRDAQQQVIPGPLPAGQDQFAGLWVDVIDGLARVEADAPVGEHAREGFAQYRSGGGHRQRLGRVDVDRGILHPAVAQ